ncbi:MAG: glycosyltransferase, partial [Candidatus Margulisiibacteriota bacterium]
MIVFTCGGTGGHIAPAITLAQELPVDYLFIGGNRLEKKMLQGFPFVEIDSSAKNPVLILKGIFQSIRLLRIHHPTAVFSTGGYVSFPVSVAAILLRIPLLILEENSIPGRVTR